MVCVRHQVVVFFSCLATNQQPAGSKTASERRRRPCVWLYNTVTRWKTVLGCEEFAIVDSLIDYNKHTFSHTDCQK